MRFLFSLSLNLKIILSFFYFIAKIPGQVMVICSESVYCSYFLCSDEDYSVRDNIDIDAHFQSVNTHF